MNVSPLKNDVAILIDCWTNIDSWIEDGSEKLFDRILDFVENTESIGTIILASYDCDPREYRSNDIWYENTRNLLGSEIYNQKCKEQFEFRKEYNTTYSKILNYHTSKQQYAMHYPWELDKLNILGKIYLCGITFSDCLKNRPLGWKSLKNYEVYVNKNCVAEVENVNNEVTYHDASFDDEWIQMNHDTWKLKKVL
jgi:hypothetical protein